LVSDEYASLTLVCQIPEASAGLEAGRSSRLIQVHEERRQCKNIDSWQDRVVV